MLDVLSAILPVFLVAGTGYAVGRVRPLDAKTLSTINLYVLIPALIFGKLSCRVIEWTFFGKAVLGVALMACCMRLILGGAARLRQLEEPERTAFLLTMFMNLGNFGLPVCAFAFGEEGLALAVVIMVCGSLLQNSYGLYLAQRSRFSIAQAGLCVLRFPMIYAFALALICQHTGWRPPVLAGRAVALLADAAIPMQLLIVGVKLAETKLESSANVFLASGLRLCLGPLAAVAVAALAGLDGLAAKVFILQMSGPVAVGMAVFSVQFDVAPRFIASVVSWTFVLSAFSVSAVLYFLML